MYAFENQIEEDNTIKNMFIMSFIFIELPLPVLFFSLFGFKLLSSVLAFQPDGIPLVSLIEKVY